MIKIMNKLIWCNLSKLLAFLVLTQSALAHRQWILPSTSIFSGKDQWVSVEAAISNDLFFPNHHAIALEQIQVLDPEGMKVDLQNSAEGKIRSTFEVLLEKEGTYKMGTESSRFFARWKDGEETKRWRGTLEEFFASEMKDKPEVQLANYRSRVETFVTSGAPSREILKPTGKGLELDFLTHPNDLFAGEKGRFRLLLEGEPLENGKVTIVQGNDRFRNEVGEIIIMTNSSGEFEVSWPNAGRFWLSASAEQGAQEVNGIQLEKRASYILTFEVLPD